MAKNQVVLSHITRISPPPPIYGPPNFICIALWLVLNAEFYDLHLGTLMESESCEKRENKKKWPQSYAPCEMQKCH